MHFHIVTIFPDSLTSYLDSSMIFAAQKKKKIKVSVYDPRKYTKDKHKKVDGRPYGGGPGMVMTAAPILSAVTAAKSKVKSQKSKIILFSPNGKQFTNTIAKGWAKKYKHLILIAGHYEGIDARVKKILKAEEISVGPYVLTGGELPALTILDSVTRQIPGVLGHELSLEETRTASREVYTRPETLEYKGKKYKVPGVLRTGDHAKIEEWRRKVNFKKQAADTK